MLKRKKEVGTAHLFCLKHKKHCYCQEKQRRV
jgi:hypothetical protein